MGTQWPHSSGDAVEGAESAVDSGRDERGPPPVVSESRTHVWPPCVVTPAEIAEAMAI